MEQMRRTLRSDDIEARIRADIDAGTYRPGDRLPAPEELAAELRKLTRAVEAAYRRLVEDGVLLEGLLEPGHFVADPAADPTVRTLLQAVRDTQLRLDRLEQRLGELTGRVASVERGLRAARREGGGHDPQF
ncbi:GntR family transcriptional regulator [Streptomyces sp. NPDC048636]|uniref:GntR family transcriptional regulator n=1 Tax=Streptomyces sp. NPDC048636 TaxID=3155762 RepID=UPI00341834E6